MQITESVIEIAATQARREFEYKPDELDRDLLAGLYRAYNPSVQDTSEFVEEAIKSFPEGACGLASLYIQYLLNGEGEVSHRGYVLNRQRHGHTVLVLAELGLISCITSDQFGGPSIYVGPFCEPYVD